MRIDFTELEKEDNNRKDNNFKIDSKLLHFLGGRKQEAKKIVSSRVKTPEIKLSVEQPYRISSSLSPKHIDQEFSYLNSKNVLPTSAIKFIKKQIKRQIDKVPAEEFSGRSNYVNMSPQRSHTSYFVPHQELVQKNTKKSKSPERDFIIIESTSPPRRKKILTEIPMGQKSQKRAKQKAHKMQKVIDDHLLTKRQRQTSELTMQPMLNYTMNSRPSKKVQKKRQQFFKSAQISVFQSLHSDAQRYLSKRQLQKIKVNEKQQMKKSRKVERVNVNSTFQERLRISLQSSAERRINAQNKQQYDLTSGDKLFQPNTRLSKLSYFSHFKSTASIAFFPQEKRQARPAHYAKESFKLNSSYEDITTTLNHSMQQMSHLNRTVEGKVQPVSTIPGKREERVSNFYADLIWADGTLHRQKLSEAEQKAMSPFLQSLGEFEYSATVSRQVFVTLFKDFMGRLNLFDKYILLQRLKRPSLSHQTSKIQSEHGNNIPKLRSSVVAPDHYHKFYYV